MTSSWANFLPLHAAGDHRRAVETGEPCSVLDLANSSYIPTLRALQEARKKMEEFTSQDAPTDANEALLVAMRTTADRRSLPKTDRDRHCKICHFASSQHHHTPRDTHSRRHHPSRNVQNSSHRLPRGDRWPRSNPKPPPLQRPRSEPPQRRGTDQHNLRTLSAGLSLGLREDCWTRVSTSRAGSRWEGFPTLFRRRGRCSMTTALMLPRGFTRGL